MKKWITKNGYTIYQILRGRSNVFAISNGNSLIIVDTSIKFCWKSLCSKIDSLTTNNLKVAALIITHAHFDHVANAADLKEKYKVKVIAQKNDTKYLVVGDNSVIVGTNKLTRVIIKAAMEKVKLRMKYKPVIPDIEVENRYDLSPLGFNAYTIYTPGHTNGCMSVIIDDEIALVGDAMVGTSKNSVYPPFGLDCKLMVESWKRLLDTGCSLFLPSHGTENSRGLVSKQYKKYSNLFKD